jgi:hypothetical protein
MGRTACTEPQCLYSRAIPLLPLWAVRPVQRLSACTRVHFSFLLHKVSLKLIYIRCVAICVRQTHELLHIFSHRCHCYIILPSLETNSNLVSFLVSQSASNFTVCDSGFNLIFCKVFYEKLVDSWNACISKVLLGSIVSFLGFYWVLNSVTSLLCCLHSGAVCVCWIVSSFVTVKLLDWITLCSWIKLRQP